MSYSENLAKVVTGQLQRFITLNRHQLAGQLANLDFWLGQAKHALDVIDGYEQRFRQLKLAQDNYVAEHGTVTTSPHGSEFRAPPAPPKRVPGGTLNAAREALADAAYKFLVRSCNDGLITETQLLEAAQTLGIGIDYSDIRRRQ